jgi:tetrahydromethanopterin S-methyltransferase subunit B
MHSRTHSIDSVVNLDFSVQRTRPSQDIPDRMSDPIPIPKHDNSTLDAHEEKADASPLLGPIGSDTEDGHLEPITPSLLPSYPPSPGVLTRNGSFLSSGSFRDDWETFPPLDKVGFLDIFDNLALPAKLEKWQQALSTQKEKVKRQQDRIRSAGGSAKDRAVREFRKRLPTADEQLDKYRQRMKKSVDDLSKRWTDTTNITVREKVSFVSAVLNVFISGYLIGACPQYFYYWFTVQLTYFMPIRYVTYHRKGYHYFLADLCYFVNLLALLTIWAFPQSKRLFIATYCLAYGNNAVAIAMWRNSLVFHSLDKVTSLFIHIMPPVVLHCMVHLTPSHILAESFPAVFNIKFSPVGSKEHYSLWAMLVWATVPYAVWQLSYHFFITVRRREKIAAGRPTSFTWLRKSYAKTWIGQTVLSLPNSLQEPAFMFIQYAYAILTILPCPLWFWYRWASAAFLLIVFGWSIFNGANYYMDVFGMRFQKELEALKRDVAKWQQSPEGMMVSPPLVAVDAAADAKDAMKNAEKAKRNSGGIEEIPMLDDKVGSIEEKVGTTAVDLAVKDAGNTVERKSMGMDKADGIDIA